MKKKVNGKIIDIRNIDVFEQAAESMAVNRKVNSDIIGKINIESNTINTYIILYSAFNRSLPFPLYALDDDVKYAAIGTFIKNKISDDIKIWVKNGLYVCIDTENNIAINFVNNTWAIVKVADVLEDNTDIDEYEGRCGYSDIKWALDRILRGETTYSYYEEFMPEFMEACNNQKMLLKWELGNILEFSQVPGRIEFRSNRIIDFENNKEYILDIYTTGVRESKTKTQQIWSLLDDNDTDIKVRPKLIKSFGFDIYEKQITDEYNAKSNEDKMKASKLFGAISLFNNLCAIRNINEDSSFSDFEAFVAEDNLVYLINGRLFITTAQKFSDSKEVARGVELYTYNNGMIYFIKPKKLGNGIRKETIYSYSLRDNRLRICKIQFTNK